MNVTHLKYFAALARYEHYGKAAQELHITQPSLSKAIRSLEEELGVYLFEKEGRGVRLTRTGGRYLEYVSRALEELERGSSLLAREQSLSEGYLDIGLISSISFREFPLWVQNFQNQRRCHPYLSLHTGPSPQLVKDLCQGRYDLIFCTSIPTYEEVEFAPILEQPLVCVVPDTHPFAGRPSVDIQELQGKDYVSHTQASRMYNIASSLFSRAGISVRTVAEATEDRTILGLVRLGMGIAVMTLSPEVHGEGYQAIPLTGTDYHRYVSMGWLKNRARSETAEEFRRFILEQAKGKV